VLSYPHYWASPVFFFFCFPVCIQYNTRKRKSGEKWNTYHVVWREVDVEGAVPE